MGDGTVWESRAAPSAASGMGEAAAREAAMARKREANCILDGGAGGRVALARLVWSGGKSGMLEGREDGESGDCEREECRCSWRKPSPLYPFLRAGHADFEPGVANTHPPRGSML